MADIRRVRISFATFFLKWRGVKQRLRRRVRWKRKKWSARAGKKFAWHFQELFARLVLSQRLRPVGSDGV